MKFMLPVPDACVPAVEICCDSSVPAQFRSSVSALSTPYVMICCDFLVLARWDAYASTDAKCIMQNALCYNILWC